MGTPATTTIEQLEEQRYAAMLTADLPVLGELLDERVRYTHSNAATDTREEYIELLRSRRLVYLSLTHITERVDLYQDTAVVTGTMQGSIEMHGTPKTLNSKILAVWVADGDKWTLAAFQPTPIPA
ncbi:nuclear transport factor 2 family protein [Rhodococcus sp. NPDC127528]|uniref:nuclear transport factor 2 family protein n=1 Tax=unclassified Rhodococcus (in: high G+C Gram-positive bacteria) TaxID=192944 RepID=UPI00363F1FAD